MNANKLWFVCVGDNKLYPHSDMHMVAKVSVGNSGHLKALDTWYTYLSNGQVFLLENFGA